MVVAMALTALTGSSVGILARNSGRSCRLVDDRVALRNTGELGEDNYLRVCNGSRI